MAEAWGRLYFVLIMKKERNSSQGRMLGGQTTMKKLNQLFAVPPEVGKLQDLPRKLSQDEKPSEASLHLRLDNEIETNVEDNLKRKNNHVEDKKYEFTNLQLRQDYFNKYSSTYEKMLKNCTSVFDNMGLYTQEEIDYLSAMSTLQPSQYNELVVQIKGKASEPEGEVKGRKIKKEKNKEKIATSGVTYPRITFNDMTAPNFKKKSEIDRNTVYLKKLEKLTLNSDKENQKDYLINKFEELSGKISMIEIKINSTLANCRAIYNELKKKGLNISITLKMIEKTNELLNLDMERRRTYQLYTSTLKNIKSFNSKFKDIDKLVIVEKDLPIEDKKVKSVDLNKSFNSSFSDYQFRCVFNESMKGFSNLLKGDKSDSKFINSYQSYLDRIISNGEKKSNERLKNVKQIDDFIQSISNNLNFKIEKVGNSNIPRITICKDEKYVQIKQKGELQLKLQHRKIRCKSEKPNDKEFQVLQNVLSMTRKKNKGYLLPSELKPIQDEPFDFDEETNPIDEKTNNIEDYIEKLRTETYFVGLSDIEKNLKTIRQLVMKKCIHFIRYCNVVIKRKQKYLEQSSNIKMKPIIYCVLPYLIDDFNEKNMEKYRTLFDKPMGKEADQLFNKWLNNLTNKDSHDCISTIEHKPKIDSEEEIKEKYNTIQQNKESEKIEREELVKIENDLIHDQDNEEDEKEEDHEEVNSWGEYTDEEDDVDEESKGNSNEKIDNFNHNNYKREKDIEKFQRMKSNYYTVLNELPSIRQTIKEKASELTEREKLADLSQQEKENLDFYKEFMNSEDLNLPDLHPNFNILVDKPKRSMIEIQQEFDDFKMISSFMNDNGFKSKCEFEDFQRSKYFKHDDDFEDDFFYDNLNENKKNKNKEITIKVIDEVRKPNDEIQNQIEIREAYKSKLLRTSFKFSDLTNLGNGFFSLYDYTDLKNENEIKIVIDVINLGYPLYQEVLRYYKMGCFDEDKSKVELTKIMNKVQEKIGSVWADKFSDILDYMAGFNHELLKIMGENDSVLIFMINFLKISAFNDEISEIEGNYYKNVLNRYIESSDKIAERISYLRTEENESICDRLFQLNMNCTIKEVEDMASNEANLVFSVHDALECSKKYMSFNPKEDIDDVIIEEDKSEHEEKEEDDNREEEKEEEKQVIVEEEKEKHGNKEEERKEREKTEEERKEKEKEEEKGDNEKEDEIINTSIPQKKDNFFVDETFINSQLMFREGTKIYNEREMNEIISTEVSMEQMVCENLFSMAKAIYVTSESRMCKIIGIMRSSFQIDLLDNNQLLFAKAYNFVNSNLNDKDHPFQPIVYTDQFAYMGKVIDIEELNIPKKTRFISNPDIFYKSGFDLQQINLIPKHPDNYVLYEEEGNNQRPPKREREKNMQEDKSHLQKASQSPSSKKEKNMTNIKLVKNIHKKDIESYLQPIVVKKEKLKEDEKLKLTDEQKDLIEQFYQNVRVNGVYRTYLIEYNQAIKKLDYEIDYVLKQKPNYQKYLEFQGQKIQVRNLINKRSNLQRKRYNLLTSCGINPPNLQNNFHIQENLKFVKPIVLKDINKEVKKTVQLKSNLKLYEDSVIEEINASKIQQNSTSDNVFVESKYNKEIKKVEVEKKNNIDSEKNLNVKIVKIEENQVNLDAKERSELIKYNMLGVHQDLQTKQVDLFYYDKSQFDLYNLKFGRVKSALEMINNQIPQVKIDLINKINSSSFLKTYGELKSDFQYFEKNPDKILKDGHFDMEKIKPLLQFRLLLDMMCITNCDYVVNKGEKSYITRDNQVQKGLKLVPKVKSMKRLRTIFLTTYGIFSKLNSIDVEFELVLKIKLKYGLDFEPILFNDHLSSCLKEYSKYYVTFLSTNMRFMEYYLFHIEKKVICDFEKLFDPQRKSYILWDNGKEVSLKFEINKLYDYKNDLRCKHRFKDGTKLENIKINETEVKNNFPFCDFCFKKCDFVLQDDKITDMLFKEKQDVYNGYKGVKKGDGFFKVKSKSRSKSFYRNRKDKNKNYFGNNKKKFNYNNAQIPIDVPPTKNLFKKGKFNRSKSRSKGKNKNINFGKKPPVKNLFVRKKFEPKYIEPKNNGAGLSYIEKNTNNMTQKDNLSTFQGFVKINKSLFESLNLRVTSSFYIIYKNNVINKFDLFKSYGLDKFVKLSLKGGSTEQENIPKVDVQPINSDETPVFETNIEEKNLKVDEFKKLAQNAENQLKKETQEEAKKLDEMVKVMETKNKEDQKEFINKFSPQILEYISTAWSEISLDKSVFFPLSKFTEYSAIRPLADMTFSDYAVITKNCMLGNYTNIFVTQTYNTSFALAGNKTEDDVRNNFEVPWITPLYMTQVRYQYVEIPGYDTVAGQDYGAENLNNKRYVPFGTNNYMRWHYDTRTDQVSNPNFVKAPVVQQAINDYYFARRKNLVTYADRIAWQDNYNLNSQMISLFSVSLLGNNAMYFSMNWDTHMLKLLLYLQMKNINRYVSNNNQHSKYQLIYEGNDYYDFPAEINTVTICYMTMGDFLQYRTNKQLMPNDYIFVPYNLGTNSVATLMYLISWMPYPIMRYYKAGYMVFNSNKTTRRYGKGRIWNLAMNISITGQKKFIVLAMDDFAATSETEDQIKNFTIYGNNLALLQYRRFIRAPVTTNLAGFVQSCFAQQTEDMYRLIISFISDYNVFFSKTVVDIVARLTTKFLCDIFVSIEEDALKISNDQGNICFNGLGQFPTAGPVIRGEFLYANSFQHIFYNRSFICPSTNANSFYVMPADYSLLFDAFDAPMISAYEDFVKLSDIGTFYFETFRNMDYMSPRAIRVSNLFKEYFFDSHYNKDKDIDNFFINIRYDFLKFPFDVDLPYGYLYHNYDDLLFFWKGSSKYKQEERIPIEPNKLTGIMLVNTGNAPCYEILCSYTMADRRKIQEWFNDTLRNCYHQFDISVSTVSALDSVAVNIGYLMFPSMYLNSITFYFENYNRTNTTFWNFTCYGPDGSYNYLLNYKRLYYGSEMIAPRYKFRFVISNMVYMSEKYGIYRYKGSNYQPIVLQQQLQPQDDWGFMTRSRDGKTEEEN